MLPLARNIHSVIYFYHISYVAGGAAVDCDKEISVTVKMVFSVNIPDTIKTPDEALAKYLVDKLSVDVKWATIKNKEMQS